MDNTTERWGWLAKSFHWIIALIILTVVSVAFVMTATYAPKYETRALKRCMSGCRVFTRLAGCWF